MIGHSEEEGWLDYILEGAAVSELKQRLRERTQQIRVISVQTMSKNVDILLQFGEIHTHHNKNRLRRLIHLLEKK